MKMNKILSLLAVVFLTAGVKAADMAAVYEVRAWSPNAGVDGSPAVEPYSSPDDPLVGGDEFRFVIRLLNSDYTEFTSSKKVWKLRYIGLYSDELAWVMNPPKIALAMGEGIVREAEFKNFAQNSKLPYYTDFICSYTVRPGDLALPVRFALTDSGTKINLVNAYDDNSKSGWVITDDDPATPQNAALIFAPAKDVRQAQQPEGLTPDRGNTDLSLSGFYVRTIDFRDRNNEESSWYDKSANVWRAVHAGSSSPEPSSAAIRVTGTPTLSSTVYIWSDDDTIVDLPEGTPTTMPAKDGKGNISRKVQSIKIEAGKIDYRFAISAMDDAEGKATVLYLSEYPGFITTAAGLVEQSYLTIPVAAIKKLEPNITVTIADSSVKVPVGNDQTVAATELTVDISAGYTGETLDVTVTPSLAAAAGEGDPWSDYVRISETNGGAAWTTATAWTGHFTNTGDPETDIVNGEKIVLYVYALGADSRTAQGANQIFFTPSTEADYFKTMNPATLHLEYEKPKLSVPGVTSAVGNVAYEFDLTVSDNYKNLNDSDGYTIEYKKKASDSKWTLFGGTWRPDAAGVLKKVGEDKELTDERPSLKYTSGTYETSFRVKVGSDTSIVSDPAITTVTVSEPARATALVSVDGGKTYVDSLVEVEEGTKINVKVELTAAYEGEADKCYAFLKAADDETKACVSGKAVIDGSTGVQTGTSGMKILHGDTISAATSITLTDGGADGTELRFEVVLCTEEQYDPGETKQVSGYQSKDLRITSMNVIPTFTKVMLGNRNTYVDAAGQTMHDSRGNLVSVPMGVEREFTFDINEPSTVDRAATGDKEFKMSYSIVEADGTTEEKELTGNPGNFSLKYTFVSAGEATVTLRLLDKDMCDPDGTKRWGEEFVFYVNVSAHPYVTLTDENGEEFSNKLFYENMTGAKNQSAHMFVKLSEKASRDLAIKLTVECEDKTFTPHDKFVLSGGGLTWDEATSSYTLTIKANQERSEIWLNEADGTQITSEKGFSIKAEVTTDTDVPTASGTKWKDYFEATTSYVTVENYHPEVNFSAMPCEENTSSNAFVVAVGTKCEFKYKLSDVPEDTNTLNVVWTVGGNTQTTATGPDDGVYTFTPAFSGAGVQSVRITVTDKDNYNNTGMVSHEWFFDVQASKSLSTLAHGPSSGFSTSAMSSHYQSAKGIGEGHVWANGIFKSASGFRLEWNMGVAANANIVASGYKVNDTDNGSLDSYDKWLDTNGDNNGGETAPATCYEYSDKVKDSYFYAWVKTAFTEGGGASGTIYGGIAPEVAGGKLTPSPIKLPDQKSGDGLGYEDTIFEAIFAKEYRKDDNCGDINQDGIPDLMVREYGLGIYDKLSGVVNGDDLADVSAYNDDADFLPGKSSSGNSLVPNVSNNWETVGGAFNAFLEIRGFGEGLNARYPNADKSLPDRDFTKYEEMAFRNYYLDNKGTDDPDLVDIPRPQKGDTSVVEFADGTPEANALTKFWKDVDKCKWTPENPTDPTMADTDNDGLPDGYEYWFWYGATVGYPDKDGKWQHLMKGYKFDEDDVENPIEIPAADVALAFNPTVPGVAEGNEATRGTLRSRDFDNDGLTDFEEFLIGTNPINCDSDGDGMPDGWEILRGLNPLSNEEVSPSLTNPDGDFMAMATLEMYEYIDGIKVPGLATAFVEWDEEGTHKVYVCPDSAIEEFEGHEDELKAEGSFRGAYLGVGNRADLFFTMNVNGAAKTIPRTRALQCAKVTIPAEAENLVVYIDRFTDYTIIHDQVYAYLGFDPRTAWYSDSVGCLGVRWHSKGGLAGMAENTAPYYTIDEFQLFKYRKATGAFANKSTIMDKFQANTTNPSKPYSKTYGDMESEYANERHGADTDGDGVPDGWELYVGLDPNNAQDAIPDTDGDTLRSPLEFAGTDSTVAYKDCESIYANKGAVWPNKFFPTDPNNPDTDGDGIEEGMQAEQEGGEWLAVFYDGRNTYGTLQKFTFNYDSSYDTEADQSVICFRGGGMNPCAVDTDFDGLPDPWEKQFAGIVVDGAGNVMFNNAAEYTERLKIADGLFNARLVPAGADGEGGNNGNGYYIIGGMDATYGLDASTDYTGSVIDNRTHTFRDYDFDGDGLQNWQEYLVQAMRSFRYDDAETPLNGRVVWWLGDAYTPPPVGPTTAEEEEEEEIEPGDVAVSPRASKDAAGGVAGYEYPQFDYCDVDAYKLAAFGDGIVPNSMGNIYNDPQNLYAANGEEWDWAALGYMAPAPNVWDPCNVFMHGKIMLPPTALMRYETFPINFGQKRIKALTYVSTDPRRWDSDDDGMDDYWELYHGLNPIYGGSGSDIIAAAYGQISADLNAWNAFGNTAPSLDFEKYPWLAGDPMGDPDGDKLRNFEEAINGNLTSPTTKHTDPSPLWMTEPTALLSVTRQSYGYLAGLGAYGWLPSTTDDDGVFAYSFERNEGFDTDNDWTTDSIEVTKGVIGATDPLVGSDPYHRSAIHFDGAGAAYQRTPLEFNNSYDMFRQFTVECWVKPEAKGGTILERGSTYDPATAGDVQGDTHWRANFRLELTAEGKVRGLFDSSAAVESGTVGVNTGCAVESPLALPLNQWSHVALSYNGFELCLYVNGEETVRTATSLVPANGVVTFLQDPTSTNYYPSASFSANPGAFVIGARHILNPMEFPVVETLGTYLQDFFTGYVSEVRIWDGARAGDAIKSEYTKAYTDEDVAANRDEIYAAWQADAERNDNATTAGKQVLPPQLVQHYNFSSLPGAVEKGDVATTPNDFGVDPTVDDGANAGYQLPQWWADNANSVKSEVYTDYRLVPWIENTVTHLKRFDGSFADSIFWAENRASYAPSSTAGFDDYVIPNGGNPYGFGAFGDELDMRLRKTMQLAGAYPAFDEAAMKILFEARYGFVGNSDLVPLGDAWAKRDVDYWDGQGAMTAWTQTGADLNGNGIPDWYEAKYPGKTGEDYMRDLVAGLLPDGTKDPDYRDLADFNGNGLPDWWEQIYGISGQNGHTDSDNDGLSNYVEYLLNEVYTIPGKAFDPVNPKTNGYVPDAYAKLGSLYIADVFTDHDHMADTWEVKFGDLAKVSPYVYDANKDADGDGWTNYAEFQADTDPTRNASLAIDGIEVAQYPVPIVEASITYLGEQNVNCPIVVQAWNCADEKSRTFQSIPDAKWTIGEVNADNDNRTTSSTNGMAKTKFVGMNPAREVMTHLSPGSVVAGSFKLECKDPGWVAVDITTGQGYTYGADSATWEEVAHDKMRNDGSGKGDIILGQNDAVVGEIDYATGAVTFDFTALPEYMIFSYNLANPTDASRWSIYTYANSYMRFSWSSKPVTAGKTSVYYLGEADPRGENNNSVGHVKEGKNNFIVFADTIDANGKYDPGEPFGVAYNVDVGWNYGKLAIEITDTNPVFARYQLTTDESDRQVIWPNSPDMVSVAGSGNASTAEEATTRVRVFMTARAVASTPTVLKPTAIATLSVMDKVIDLSAAGRDYIHEGDILDPENGIYDIAWNCMPNPESEDVVEAVFTILRGNTQIGSTQSLAQVLDGSNVFVQAQSVIRRYDAKDNRKKAVQIAPAPQLESVVNSPRPTFKWADASVGTYVYNTYTAFQIKVTGVDNSFSWTSGLQLMPPKSADGYYSWTAPICANCVTKDGKLFENGKRYKWQISTYNAKFKADYYGGEATFYLNVPEDQLDYGAIDVAVKYFGHPDVLNGGIVRVEAFDTPDFSGLSASAGYVTDLGSVSDSTTAPTKNASIIGLTEGSYYVMAYIDTNKNGKRDGWESWGYACVRDQREGIIYTPKSVKVGPKVGTRNLVTVYIDDCDTDQDALPDAWEWTKSGSLTAKGVAELLTPPSAGSYVSVKDLVGDLKINDNPVARGLATLMSTSLGNANLLTAMMSIDVKEGENPNDAIINASNDAKIAEHSLSIANFEVADGKAKFSVVADVESGAADPELAVFYTFPAVENLEVEYQILKYSSLAANPDVVKTGSITLGKTEAEIEIPIDPADATGAMYQIKVFQK